MAKMKIKTGNVDVPDDDFKDENMTAHISMRIQLDLLHALRKLSLNEEYEGRYQVLMRDILREYVQKNKGKKRAAI